MTATTGVWADVTERVAGGDIAVEQLVPDDVSPHSVRLDAEHRKAIEESVLLVTSGAKLEPWADGLKVRRFVAAEHAGKLRPGDPHLWMDPTRVEAALPALAESLAKADPPHAAGYRSRAREYAAELRQADADIRRTVEPIPRHSRVLLTSHDAMGYFADRYGFRVIPAPPPGTAAEVGRGLGQIDAAENDVLTSAIRSVFAIDTDDPAIVEKIADDTGIHLEEGLLVESPGGSGGYADMLRQDAELIHEGLLG